MLFADVHVMIIVGFGFLMTFLSRYGFSSVGLNLLVAAVAMQWGILCVAFFHAIFDKGFHLIEMNIEQLVEGDFASAAALITFGALLGKTSPVRIVLVVIFEMIFYALNYQLLSNGIGASDIGGSMAIHAFGAYFGLACSWVISPKKSKDHPKNGSVYHSDLFAMIGTAFLWVFWPSFVAIIADDTAKARCIIHCYFAITASCVTAFTASQWIRPHKKFDMVDVQNATLAGGVSIGAVADFALGGPSGAIVVGMAAGLLSVVGYTKIQPWLDEKINLQDTCGVHNLHGMPGVLGGILSILGAFFIKVESNYGDQADKVFQQTSVGAQVGAQVGALLATLAIAIVSGLFVGWLVMKITCGDVMLFDDSQFWEVPEEGFEQDLEAAVMEDPLKEEAPVVEAEEEEKEKEEVKSEI
jgi:ammonium transporter Rh